MLEKVGKQMLMIILVNFFHQLTAVYASRDHFSEDSFHSILFQDILFDFSLIH